jgi:hypothetical protein
MFTIIDTPHKGRGIFAIRPLPKETIILKERPLLLAEDAYDAIYQLYGHLVSKDCDDAASDDAIFDTTADMQTQFESLAPQQMDDTIISSSEIEKHISTLPQYMEDFFRSIKLTRLRLLIAKFYRNAFRNQHNARDTSSPPSAILIQGALMNHSCANNVDFYVDREGYFIFYTNRDIITGEELCDTYLDTTLSFKKRHTQLQLQYGFICTCAKCEKDVNI